MKKNLLSCLLIAAALPGALGAADARPRDQDAALDAVRSGRSQPLPMLERRVVPRIQGDYLGRPEYDAGRNVYRMKFMHNGSVIWVDVNGQTGQIVGQTGN